GRGTQARGELGTETRLLRIRVVRQRALQDAVGIEEVDAAPVGNGRDYGRCDGLQRGLRLERARKLRTSCRKKLQSASRAFGGSARGSFGREQLVYFGCSQGARGVVQV